VEHPGFLGHLAIEVADGSTIVVNVWESDSHAQAGLHALGPDVQRLEAPGVANAGAGE
jgi:hypothetical protein